MSKKRKHVAPVKTVGCDCGHPGGPHTDKCALQTRPDWSGHCDNCGASPIVPITGLCGPCTWGDSDTIGGNW